MSYLICNIGNHDVQLASEMVIDGLTVGPVIHRTLVRQVGERILADLDQYLHSLRIPLIEPLLEYLDGETIREIVLVVTDQADEKFRRQDTLFLGRIVRECLQRRRWIPKTPKITIMVTKDYNPADYDDMNVFYRDKIRHLKERFDPNEKVFLALAGGTPAMNTFTMLHGVGFFGAKAEALYSRIDDRRPVPLRVGRDLVVQRARDEILSLVGSYDYYAAQKKVESLAVDIGCSDSCNILMRLLGYAHSRVSFDFEQAIGEIDKAMQLATGRNRQQLQDLRSDLYHSGTGDLLRELLHNMFLKATRGEFIDLLARVFRFQEAAYRAILEKLGVEFKSEKRLDPKWISGVPALKSYLGECTVDGGPLEYKRDVNRRVMEAILNYYAEKAEDQLAKKARDYLVKVDRLADLRNHTPSAHGFQGVSKQIVEQHYDGSFEELLEDLSTLVRLVDGDGGSDVPFYQRTNRLAEEFIGQID